MEDTTEKDNLERAAIRNPSEVDIICWPYTSNGTIRESEGVMRNYSTKGSYIETPCKFKSGIILFHFEVTLEEAEKRIANREAKRKAFIRRNFRKNIGNYMHYDLVINTERMDLETCTEMVIGAIKGAQVNRAFEKANAYILKSKNNQNRCRQAAIRIKNSPRITKVK